MIAAFAGATSMSLGFLGLIIGAVCAGLVYVAIAIIVKFAGVNWLNKIMPVAVIGPTVTIIGMSLAGNAVGDLSKGSVTDAAGLRLHHLLSQYYADLLHLLQLYYVLHTAKRPPSLFLLS